MEQIWVVCDMDSKLCNESDSDDAAIYDKTNHNYEDNDCVCEFYTKSLCYQATYTENFSNKTNIPLKQTYQRKPIYNANKYITQQIYHTNNISNRTNIEQNKYTNQTYISTKQTYQTKRIYQSKQIQQQTNDMKTALQQNKICVSSLFTEIFSKYRNEKL